MRVRTLLSPLLFLSALCACGDGDDSVTTVGLACDTDYGCDPAGASVCAKGFFVLAGDESPDIQEDAETSIGVLMPPDTGYCVPLEGCRADSDCPGDSACFRPLEGVDPSAYADATFDAAELEAGRCLSPCESADECRQEEGFTCAVPLATELAGIAGVATRTFCIPEPIEAPCVPDESRNQPGTCTLTYAVDTTFEITGTPLGRGDGVYRLPSGTLIVRVPSADGSVPSATGAASLLCYDVKQQFGEPSKILTAVRAFASATGAEALATGTLDAGTLTWGACTYPADYCAANAPWTPAVGATGPGCIEGYRSIGDVLCGYDPGLCAIGGLSGGHNPQDDTWTQSLNSLVFTGGDGFDEVAMGGAGTQADAACTTDRADWIPTRVEIPNDAPGSTWLSFVGALVSTECTAP